MWYKHHSSAQAGRPGRYLIIVIFVLILFGLVILFSASQVAGYNMGDKFLFFKHQLLKGFLPGLILFFICAKIPYKFWQKQALKIFIISIILLLLVFIPGLELKNNPAKSWIIIGDFSIQPSEIVKLTLIIYLAAWLAKCKNNIKSFSHGFIPFIIFLGTTAGLVALEPDMGTMFIIIIIALGMYFIAGAKILHITSFILTLAIASFGVIKIWNKFDPDNYRLHRILTFLNPTNVDMQGVGYHLNQALLAIGSGGIFGLGFGNSRQKFGYLPQVEADSIFAIIAEELGFIVAVVFIIFLTFFVIKVLKISQQRHDDFAKFFSAGLALWIGGQSFLNIGAMIGILPLTGVPLPFISYGGTALAMLMAGSGILINIAKN